MGLLAPIVSNFTPLRKKNKLCFVCLFQLHGYWKDPTFSAIISFH